MGRIGIPEMALIMLGLLVLYYVYSKFRKFRNSRKLKKMGFSKDVVWDTKYCQFALDEGARKVGIVSKDFVYVVNYNDITEVEAPYYTGRSGVGEIYFSIEEPDEVWSYIFYGFLNQAQAYEVARDIALHLRKGGNNISAGR